MDGMEEGGTYTRSSDTAYVECMTLSEEARIRALEIKAEVESLGQINNLSDMDYAQFAITFGVEMSMEKIIDRIYKLQCFKSEYGLNDTVEEGSTLMRKLILSQPGYILSVDFAPKYGAYIFVFDFAAFNPTRCTRSKHDLRIFMGGIYYIFKCLTANLQAIQEGVVFITECDGMRNNNFDWRLEEKFMHELMSNFPFRYKECVSYVLPRFLF